MARHIPNPDKLLRILEHHQEKNGDPYCFAMNESLRIRQLVAESLVTFFAKLHDLPDPGPQPIPVGTPGTEKPTKRGRRR